MKCIYSINHTSSGRYYIGSTLNFDGRKRRHINDLNAGTHHCAYLQRLWNKSKHTDFTFSIIEKITDNKELLVCEQRHIDIGLKSGLLLNVCKTAGNCLGVRQSEQTKLKRALKLCGTKRTDEQCRRISEARKRVGITPEHQKLLNEISSKRRFRISDELALSIKNRRLNDLVSLDTLAKEIGITIKPLRRELKRHFGAIQWPRIKPRNLRIGAEHGMAKLSEQDVKSILNDRRMAKIIAGEYGVSTACIHDIRYGRSWTHVKP